MRSRERWVAERYRTLRLPDARLERRLLRISETLCARPSDSVNQASPDWAAAKATYRFIANESVNEEHLRRPVCDATALDCAGQPCVIAVQDTTVLSFPSARGAQGLGPVNDDPNARGLLLHPVLALRPDGLALGLLDWQTWARPLKKRAEVGESYRDLPIEKKESAKWLRGIDQARRAIERNLPSESRPRLMHVFDREGDIHEVFERVVHSPDGMVVRCNHNRGVWIDGGRVGGRAHDMVAASKRLGTVRVDVPRKQGQKKRSARLELRAVSVTLTPNRCSHPDREWVDLTLVEAREPRPPKGVAPLRWLLWTTEPADTFEQALAIVDIYKLRWRIEEFNLVLKSGCRIEALQFETRERIEKAVALYAPIAVRILQLRDLSRIDPDAPCTAVLSDKQWRALWIAIHRSQPTARRAPPTVREATLWIGRLGGHLNRKSDGMPGVRTLWRGWRDLELLTLMYEVTSH